MDKTMDKKEDKKVEKERIRKADKRIKKGHSRNKSKPRKKRSQYKCEMKNDSTQTNLYKLSTLIFLFFYRGEKIVNLDMKNMNTSQSNIFFNNDHQRDQRWKNHVLNQLTQMF